MHTKKHGHTGMHPHEHTPMGMHTHSHTNTNTHTIHRFPAPFYPVAYPPLRIHCRPALSVLQLWVAARETRTFLLAVLVKVTARATRVGESFYL